MAKSMGSGKGGKMMMGMAKQAKGATPKAGVKMPNPSGGLKKSNKPTTLQKSKMPNKAGL